jgi:hypothetical protein
LPFLTGLPLHFQVGGQLARSNNTNASGYLFILPSLRESELVGEYSIALHNRESKSH